MVKPWDMARRAIKPPASVISRPLDSPQPRASAKGARPVVEEASRGKVTVNHRDGTPRAAVARDEEWYYQPLRGHKE